MDAFFCITFTTIILMMWWKRNFPAGDRTRTETKTDWLRNQKTGARARDVAELRKQGYTDELIATILPITNNDN